MNNIQTTFNRRYHFIAFVLIATLLLAPSPKAYLQNHNNDRDEDKILEEGSKFKPPVEITTIRSKAGVIKPGVMFSGDEDWIQGLTMGVRNKSDKPITHISLRILFPCPEGQKGELDFVELLNYGESPIPYEDGRVPVNSAKAVLPGESIELKLSDENYMAVKALLKESKYSSIKRIKVDVETLGFSDGTLWMAGKMYTLDENDPGKLIPVKKLPAPHKLYRG